MNTYNLRQQIGKLQRLVAQYEIDIPRFRSQIAAWTAEANAIDAKKSLSLKQSDAADPAAFIAAERALNSNSVNLMRARFRQLKEATQKLVLRVNTLSEAGNKEESDKLWNLVLLWEPTYQALQARADQLEKNAAVKQEGERQRVERRNERIARDNAQAQMREAKRLCLERRNENP